MVITDLQKKVAQAIVNIFETGRVQGDYSNVTSISSDPGGLTYGRSQTTLMSGNLYLLIEDYCETENADFADELKPYLGRIKAKDTSLNRDLRLHNLLRQAGQDWVMQEVQDAFFDRVYWNPAVAQAQAIGITTPLGFAVVYDSVVHGSWGLMRDRTNQKYGTLANISEQTWVSRYVDTRREWLANHSIKILNKTVYRMDAFRLLISSGNWDLILPITVRGNLINEDTLTKISTASADIAPQRLLQLTMPYMSGDDVRKVQHALVKAGFKLDVDGIFGKDTDAAIKQFQKQKNLKADGIVGQATLAALGVH